MSLFDGLAGLIFGAKDPTPRHYEGDYDLTTRGDGAMWRLRAFQELGARDAQRKARAARWRRSWLRKAGLWLRRIAGRGDRGQAGRTAPEERRVEAFLPAPGGGGDPDQPVADGLHSVYEALTRAQLVARRTGHRELADALHALFLLDLTGNIAEAAPLVASVRASLQTALGDNSRAIN